MSVDDLKTQSEKINDHLKKCLKNFSGRWGAFVSMASEPLVDWKELNLNIQWYFVQTEDQKLNFVRDQESLQAQDLDGICIPALGFNLNGARLGRGGGFYDREFENYKGNKIGIAFDFAVDPAIPYEAHDIKVDVIVTDRRIVDAA